MRSSACRFSYAFILIVSSLPCGGGAKPAAQEIGAEARRHFAPARQAQDADDLDKAAREYLEVVRLEPALAEAYVNLGLVYHVQGKFEESIAALEKAQSLKPGLLGASLYLGIGYAKINQCRRALPHLKSAVEQEPASKEARFWLVSALWDAGDGAAALQQLRKAVEALPRDQDFLFLLGEAYQKTANRETESVAAASAGTPLINEVYGGLYVAQQAWEKAIRHYQRASEKDPHWPGAHLGLGEVYLRQHKLNDAQREFRQELQIDPASAAARARLAEIAILKGEPSEALKMMEAAIRVSPGEAANALGLPHLAVSAGAEPDGQMQSLYRQSLAALESAPAGCARDLALAMVFVRLGLDDASRREWTHFENDATRRAPATKPYARAVEFYNRHDFDAAERSCAACWQRTRRTRDLATCWPRPATLSPLRPGTECWRLIRTPTVRTSSGGKPTSSRSSTKRPSPNSESWRGCRPRWRACTSRLATCCG